MSRSPFRFVPLWYVFYYSKSYRLEYFRNLSQGSTDTGIGSLEKRPRANNNHRDVRHGRVDANDVIKELLEGVDLQKPHHDNEASCK